MTLSEKKQPAITVTTKAVEKILDLMAERELGGHYLRLFVEGIGYAGFQTGLAFSEEPQKDDTVIDSNGIRILIDPYTLICLEGVTVDYVDTPEGADFKIDNPNAMPGSACATCGGGCG